jgi:hypothetical protein
VEIDAAAIVGAVQAVTKRWAKVRMAEEREQARRYRRADYIMRPHRETIKEVAGQVMAAAYRKASAEKTLPATARQVMYAARPAILERTKRRDLDDQYFTQTLLPDYLAEHPEETADWDVVFDARGHLREPHTEKSTPLGTLAVRKYLSDIEWQKALDPGVAVAGAGADFPTCGPDDRFGGILFIEKEGFLPLFEAVHLDSRYDVAIMTTKGVSTTAARRLVDTLCAPDGIPLFVLHDFDKAGFSILGTLSRDTRRYTFSNDVPVIDLGLRLADVQQWRLPGEPVIFGPSDPESNLRENGATADEISFLCSGRDYRRCYTGHRVELNAFTSDQLIAWLEGKLAAHGVKKVVPSAETLARAYRRALHATLIRRAVDEMDESVRKRVQAMKVPTGLARHVEKAMTARRERPWDAVIAEMAVKQLDKLEQREGR